MVKKVIHIYIYINVKYMILTKTFNYKFINKNSDKIK